VNKTLIPLLAAHGVHVSPDNVIALPNSYSTSDAGNVVAAIQNATLKFRTNNVTHVLVMDDAGGVTLFFAHDTQSEHYYPRLGVNSENSLETWLESGDVSAQQANGAMGLGWEPTGDLPTSANGDKSRYSTPARVHCLAVMKSAGITFSSTNAELIALEFCDRLYLLKRVFDLMDPSSVSRQAFMQKLESLGASWQASSLVQTSFGPGRHDAVSLGYDLTYNNGCNCMTYTGSPFTLP
jgi:hypothetical protein